MSFLWHLCIHLFKWSKTVKQPGNKMQWIKFKLLFNLFLLFYRFRFCCVNWRRKKLHSVVSSYELHLPNEHPNCLHGIRILIMAEYVCVWLNPFSVVLWIAEKRAQMSSIIQILNGKHKKGVRIKASTRLP